MIGYHGKLHGGLNQQHDQDQRCRPPAVAFTEAHQGAREDDSGQDPSSVRYLLNRYREQQDKIEGCELRAVRLTVIHAHEGQKPIHHIVCSRGITREKVDREMELSVDYPGAAAMFQPLDRQPTPCP